MGVDTRFSVGVAITAEPIRQAILALKNRSGDWAPAPDGDGEPLGADIYELTGMIPDDGFPAGTRFIVRRERPHPGSQLSLFDTIEGLRHQVMATDTPPGQGPIQFLEAVTADTPASRTASAPAGRRLRPVPRPVCSPSTPPGYSSP